MILALFRFIKSQFQRSSNGIIQITLLNMLAFLIVFCCRLVKVVTGYKAAYIALFQYGSLPAAYTAFVRQPWTLLTHFWLHTSFASILWGLIWLQIFGPVVRYQLGNRNFIAIYVLGGFVSGLFFLLVYNLLPHLQGTVVYLVGFSGSLYAIMAAAATLTPHHTYALLFFNMFKLKYIAWFFVLLALIHLTETNPATCIAQLGGALLGYAYVRWHKHGVWWWRKNWRRPIRPKQVLSIVRYNHATYIKQEACSSEDTAHLDKILDKVAHSGYESLTPAEKKFLFDAGQ